MHTTGMGAFAAPVARPTADVLMIEKGIPLPPRRGGREPAINPLTRRYRVKQRKRGPNPFRTPLIDALERMAVGDSVFSATPPDMMNAQHRAAISARANTWAAQHHPSRLFTLRQFPTGCRIWRIA